MAFFDKKETNSTLRTNFLKDNHDKALQLIRKLFAQLQGEGKPLLIDEKYVTDNCADVSKLCQEYGGPDYLPPEQNEGPGLQIVVKFQALGLTDCYYYPESEYTSWQKFIISCNTDLFMAQITKNVDTKKLGIIHYHIDSNTLKLSLDEGYFENSKLMTIPLDSVYDKKKATFDITKFLQIKNQHRQQNHMYPLRDPRPVTRGTSKNEDLVKLFTLDYDAFEKEFSTETPKPAAAAINTNIVSGLEITDFLDSLENDSEQSQARPGI